MFVYYYHPMTGRPKVSREKVMNKHKIKKKDIQTRSLAKMD
jgi:hypothetical protein